MQRNQYLGGVRPPLAVDVAHVVLVAGLVTAAIHADIEPGSRAPDLFAYSLAVGIGAMLLLRRRSPVLMLCGSVALLLAYHALSYPAIGIAVPLAAALYAAAVRGYLRSCVVAVIVPLVVSMGYRLIFEHEAASYVLGYDLPVNAGMMAAVIALGDSVRSRRGWRLELLRRVSAAEEQRDIQTARLIEQQRVGLARELHDVLSHTISVISLHTDVARESLRDDPDVAEASLTAVRGATSDAIRELRSTVDLLRLPENSDGARAPAAGVARLDGVLRSVREAGLPVELRTVGDPVPLPAAVDSTAHRIVQESLTNVLRHANADSATVELCYLRSVLVVRVSDDGHGANGQHDGGWGIVGMRERAGLLGGDLRTESTSDGFTVRAQLPIEGRA